MKPRSSFLAAFLLLACAAALGAAEPAATSATPAAPEAVAQLPADNPFATAVVDLPADCFKDEAKAETAGGGTLPRTTCGICSAAICVYRPVGWVCGSGPGGAKWCQDFLGDVCSDGGAFCRCSNAEIP